jgi:hypothetical protein
MNLLILILKIKNIKWWNKKKKRKKKECHPTLTLKNHGPGH